MRREPEEMGSETQGLGIEAQTAGIEAHEGGGRAGAASPRPRLTARFYHRSPAFPSCSTSS